nr:hypothetical protein [Nocardioides mesophilus]
MPEDRDAGRLGTRSQTSRDAGAFDPGLTAQAGHDDATGTDGDQLLERLLDATVPDHQDAEIGRVLEVADGGNARQPGHAVSTRVHTDHGSPAGEEVVEDRRVSVGGTDHHHGAGLDERGHVAEGVAGGAGRRWCDQGLRGRAGLQHGRTHPRIV